jgi:LIVCS family branched-chain amino acid:cation transporter
MSANSTPSTLVVGLAFFSMFFGAGNLIFPLMLGAQFESQFVPGAVGFIITAVLLPMLGILAMIPAEGKYESLFINLLPQSIYRWLLLVILLFWIPFGSGPRCVILAHASINTYVEHMPPLWLFSFLFLTLVFLAITRRRKLIDLLGKFLTPVLLISIAVTVLTSFMHGTIDENPISSRTAFFEGVANGYYTQDLIAAVFFSSALFGMINLSEHNRQQSLKKTWHGGLIAVALLAVLYASLMGAAAIHAEHLRGLSGEKLVSTLAHIALGRTFGGISSVAVSVACFTTEIALIIVFAEFLHRHFFHQRQRRLVISISLAIVWVMSLIEFGGIMSIIAPAMQVLYPILFLLVVRCLWRCRFKSHCR